MNLFLVVIIYNAEITNLVNQVQTFYDLKDYTTSLIEELIYIDSIESNYLQNEIDYNLILIKKNLIMLKSVNIVIVNLTILIMIDILSYT